MGYTHHFNINKPFTSDEVSKITKAVKSLFNALPKHSHSSGAEYKDEELVIANGHGEKAISHADELFGVEKGVPYILFNGFGDLGYESMMVHLPSTDKELKGSQGDFIKTARRPYDLFVQAVLLAIENISPDKVKVGSDGGPDDWSDAYNFTQEALGKSQFMPSGVEYISYKIKVSDVFRFIPNGMTINFYAETLAQSNMPSPGDTKYSHLIDMDSSAINIANFRQAQSAALKQKILDGFTAAFKEVQAKFKAETGISLAVLTLSGDKIESHYPYQGAGYAGDTIELQVYAGDVMEHLSLTNDSFSPANRAEELKKSLLVDKIFRQDMAPVSEHDLVSMARTKLSADVVSDSLARILTLQQRNEEQEGATFSPR
jgi:hypothetical protein